MKSKTLKAAAGVLAVALLHSSPLWSLGLGEAEVDSYLGQPLEVRIDLITSPTDDLSSVMARVASAEDYELIGASRASMPVPVRFTVMDPEGDAYLLATSRLEINEPVVRLIVELNWSKGRMLREYTLFLDPPAVAATPPPPRIDERAGTRRPVAERRTPAPQPAEPAAAEAEQRRVPASGEYGPVRSGQTLWGIASDWSRDTGLSINKTMIAIQRDNPEAFLNGNINLLRQGAILRMPQPEDVQSIPASVAQEEVRRQIEQFQVRSAAPSAEETPLLADESAAPEPVVSAPEPQDVRDELELVPPSGEETLESTYGFEEPDEEAGAGQTVQALREELSRKEEELINEQQQNAYLEQRIAELEEQIAAAGEGAIADEELAGMEERLRQQREAEAAPPAAEEVPAVRARQEEEEPWYSGFVVWLIALLALAAAVGGWLYSRRGEGGTSEAAAARQQESLREAQESSEDVIRALDTEREAETAEPAGEAAPESEPEREPEPEPEPGAEEETKAERPSRAAPEAEDAELLDEDSADPEIQLDLARAYVSMGDKEAARVILEEVISSGNEKQQEEARAMMEQL